MTIRENITLAHIKQFFANNLISIAREKVIADEMKQKLNIKAPSTETRVRNLSGGNQQKVVVAKWLMKAPKVLIMDEPTRGIDVGAKHEIYNLILDLVKQGVSVIMISSELNEIIGMCDRCLVIGNGRSAGILEKEELEEKTIMMAATAN
jgi:ABC-type sugar transport system ATPase subunit